MASGSSEEPDGTEESSEERRGHEGKAQLAEVERELELELAPGISMAPVV